MNRFGQLFELCICRDRPKARDKWHLDEVVISINGVKYWLWRAIDASGDVLDILLQSRRNTNAAKRFFRRLTKTFGESRAIVTDKLRSYGAAVKMELPKVDYRAHKGLNNRIEGAHRLT